MKQYHGTYACFFLFHVSDDRALCKPGCASLVVIHWYSWRFWWWLVMFVFIDLKWPRVFRCSTPSCYYLISIASLSSDNNISYMKLWSHLKQESFHARQSKRFILIHGQTSGNADSFLIGITWLGKPEVNLNIYHRFVYDIMGQYHCSITSVVIKCGDHCFPVVPVDTRNFIV